jgi:hypothetical protein
MFTQPELQTAIENVIDGRIYSDWNVTEGWSYSSDSVVFSKGADYLYVTTDGWRTPDQRKVVIKNMRGRTILSMI